ncbi:MAG TPA: amidohydrolase, partial [Chitinophagaceae bacterium]|nr:amidohydrolase [Chitinophagaceae bacterium]
MAFRKFSAEYIFNGFEFLPPNTVIVTDEEGVICAITSQEDAGGDVQHHAGILSPGLINAHCHVELSHMKDTIPKGIGLINFLINVVKK